MLQKVLSAIGVVGTVACIILYAREPSFPTPDKLLVFLIFVFMIFHKAIEMLKRFLPFVLILLAYESFRGVADGLNKRVEYMWMVDVDRWLFGGTLPTTTLQKWWWHGQVQWYDFVFYITYMLHFVFPITLALIVWKYRPKKYWQVIVTYVTVSFVGFFVFLLFPAAPPWMSSNLGYIENITRISSDVWAALGIHNFPSVYNQISPNPVAAVPSLHAAYATVFALYITTLFRSRWRFLSWVYPALIYTGTVYQGEHYAIDEILGALLGLAVFFASPWLTRKIGALLRWLSRLLRSVTWTGIHMLNYLIAPRGGKRDVAYGKNPAQLFDMYPSNSPEGPVVIFWHGGAWTRGNKKNYVLVARRLKKLGAITVLAGYPTYPEQKFPGFIDDAYELIEKIRKLYPKNKIYLMGHSSGAHTAAIAGMTSKDKIAGVITLAAPCLIGKPWQHIFSAPVSSGKQNPASYISKSSRSTRFLLIHGQGDSVVLASDSITFNDKLRSANRKSELLVLNHVGHAMVLALFMIGASRKINQAVSRFIDL